jgi:hypothetical protein
MSYITSKQPISSMSHSEIKAEAKELRIQITMAQGGISKGRTWAMAKGTFKSQEHLEWLANARTCLANLQNRYMAIRAAEKEINAKEHEHG